MSFIDTIGASAFLKKKPSMYKAVLAGLLFLFACSCSVLDTSCLPGDPTCSNPLETLLLYSNTSRHPVWIAVGASGLVMYSYDDGLSWTNSSSSLTGLFKSIAYDGKGRWLIGDSSTSNLYFSDDQGKTWQAVTASTGLSGTSINAIYYFQDYWWVADGGTGQNLARSRDLVSWQFIKDFGSGNDLSAMTSRDGTLYAVDASGNFHASSDFVNWSSVSVPSGPSAGTSQWTLAVLPSGRILSGGDSASPSALFYSDDNGQSWNTSATSLTTENFQDFTKWQSRYLVISNSSSNVYYTTDGSNYQQVATGSPNSFNSIAGVGNTVIAVGVSASVYRSEDGGSTWTQITGLPTTGSIQYIRAASVYYETPFWAR